MVGGVEFVCGGVQSETVSSGHDATTVTLSLLVQ